MPSTIATRTKKRSNYIESIKKKLKGYQKTAVKFMLSRPVGALFLVPGLGKTIITLLAFAVRKELGQAKTMLVVSSVGIIYSVWPMEIKKWDLPFKVSIIHGTVAQRKKALATKADVYLTNYENLAWLADTLKGSDRYMFDMCVLDESTKIKRTNTKRFKAIRKIAGYFKFRYILTGSPMPNGLKDLFGQIWFLDLGKSLGSYITKFLTEYFYPAGYKGYDWQPYPDSYTRIFKKIKHLVLRIGPEVLKLPPLVPVNREFYLSDEMRSKYLELENEFIADVENGVIVAATAATKSMKLRQFTSGAVYNEYHDPIFVHDEKIDQVKEIVDELQGSPCIIAYEFNHELDRLRKAFPKASFIGKGVKPAEAVKIEQEWNKGNIEVLLANTATIAHGRNLQESGRHIIVFSMTWNLEDYEQLIKRLHRQGQKNTVFVIHLLALDTVDIVMKSAIESKDKTQQTMLNAFQKHYKFKNPIGSNTSTEELTMAEERVIQLFKEYTERNQMEMPVYKKGDVDLFVAGLLYDLTDWGHDLNRLFLEQSTGHSPQVKELASLWKLSFSVILKAFDITATDKGYKVKKEALLKKSSSKVISRLTPKAIPENYQLIYKEGATMEKTLSKFADQKEPVTREEADASDEARASKKKTSKKKAVTSAPTGKKKVAKKKVAAKKKAAKKKVAASSTAQRKVNTKKKIAGKKKAVSNKGAAGNDKKVNQLTKLLSRKKGCSATEAQEKLGVSRPTILKMINNLGAEKIEHGVYKL